MVEQTQHLFDKVQQMRVQRASLIQKLRRALHEDDDPTGDLLTKSRELIENDQSGWFDERLTKHDQLISIIRQNMLAQSNIQSSLIDLNADFALKWEELKELRQK